MVYYSSRNKTGVGGPSIIPSPHSFLSKAILVLSMVLLSTIKEFAMAETDTLILDPILDASLFQGELSDIEDGNSIAIYLGKFMGNTMSGVMGFDLSSIPSGATINSAILKLYGSHCETFTTQDSRSIGFQKIINSTTWDESTIDYDMVENSYSTEGQKISVDFDCAALGQLAGARRLFTHAEFYEDFQFPDVDMKTMIGVDETLLTFLITSDSPLPDNNDAMYYSEEFASKEASDPYQHPKLEITYTLASTSAPLQTTYSYTASQSAAKFDWNITLTDPLDIIKPTTEQGIYKMVTKYILDDQYYSVSIYKKDCVNKPTPEDAIPLVVADIDNDINTNKENIIELMLLYNQTSVETSDLWTANKTGGYSEFCIKVRNFLEEDGDPLAREIHFLEVKYKIEVDSLTDFNETITVDRIDATDGGVEEINYEEEIEVFQCEDDFSEITSTVPLTQGDFLQLCVTTVSGSKFGVHSIKELDVSQEDSSPSLYPYIDGFIDSPLAESACDTTVANTSAAVCKAKMQLLSAYFDSTEPDALFANGTVKLDYVGRRLSVDVPVSLRYDGGGAVTAEEAVAAAGRNLAEGDEGPSFGIEVGLSGDDGSANDASLSLLSMGGLFSAGMAFLVAGMV